MTYETPKVTLSTLAVDAIQAGKPFTTGSDNAVENDYEVIAAYADWE